MPLALHIPHVVEQVGSLAGFAAVIGLAVLSALYFSQARDLRRLREWAGRAPERAAEMGPGVQSPLPGRVVAQPQQPRPVQPQQPPPATTPAAASNGDAAPAVAAAPGAAKPADAGEPDAEEAKAGDAQAADEKPEQAKDGEEAQPAGAKPGMPAPASAAAAGVASATGAAAGAGSAAASAGAGAASVAGPKAPSPSAPAGQPASAASGGVPAPGAPAARPAPGPQRPPGSVLPPRTGTMPPVRRLPSSNVGAGSPSALGAQPAPQKKKRNPVYVVLAVAGVLVLGAAAAVGVPALVNGSKSDSSTTAAKTQSTTTSKKTAALTPGKITVAVLNGTGVQGLAGQIGDRVEADGFRKGTISNASLTNGQRANSVVMYASGHSRDARLVARKLSISGPVQPVDSATQQIAGDASVVVVVGTDKTQ